MLYRHKWRYKWRDFFIVFMNFFNYLCVILVISVSSRIVLNFFNCAFLKPHFVTILITSCYFFLHFFHYIFDSVFTNNKFHFHLFLILLTLQQVFGKFIHLFINFFDFLSSLIFRFIFRLIFYLIWLRLKIISRTLLAQDIET